MHWDLESCRAQQWPVPTYGIMELDDTGVTLCWVIGHYLLLLYYMYYIKSQCPTQPHLGLILSAYTIILLTLNHGSIPCWNRWNLILMYYQMISLNVIYSCVLNCFIRGLDKNWIELNRQWSSNKNHGLLPVLQRLLNYTKIQCWYMQINLLIPPNAFHIFILGSQWFSLHLGHKCCEFQMTF